jgi:hypothetical protein
MSAGVQPPSRPLRQLHGELDAITLIVTSAITQVADSPHLSLPDIPRPPWSESNDQSQKREHERLLHIHDATPPADVTLDAPLIGAVAHVCRGGDKSCAQNVHQGIVPVRCVRHPVVGQSGRAKCGGAWETVAGVARASNTEPTTRATR